MPWKCEEHEEHNLFVACPKRVHFSGDMAAWEMFDWKEVLCAVCRSLAHWEGGEEWEGLGNTAGNLPERIATDGSIAI